MRGRAWARHRAGQLDAWFRDRFRAVVADDTGVALVAVGGYGRGLLCPASDVDVVVVHDRSPDAVAPVAEALWYPLWDAGLKVGHATRTLREAATLADRDLPTATSMLSVRHLAGDVALARTLADAAAQRWRRRWRRRLGELARAVDERHRRAGEVAFELEPDLKEGRGGLRDADAIRWAIAAGAVHLGISEEDLTAVEDVLLDVRVALHLVNGRPGDVLTLDRVAAVAELCGTDPDGLAGRLSAAARRLAWLSDQTWERVTSTLAGPVRRAFGRERPVAPGITLRDGALHLTGPPTGEPAPVVALRLARLAAVHGARVEAPTLRALAEDPGVMPDPWPVGSREDLVDLLGAGPPAVRVLETLDQLGLLVRILPEWEPVRCRPQRNPYHRFTVDRHLCEAAAEAAALADRVERPDLLVVAAWLHDLGKGHAGDHTEVGVGLMARIAPRMGFGGADVAVLCDLVRHHLLLPETATRRDIDDPVTIGRVAAAVGDTRRLDLLAALTEADARATGPTAWTPWRAELVGRLVERVRRHLEGGPPVGGAPPFPGPGHLELAATGGTVVRADGDTLLVAAPDRPGLFSRIAGALALAGLDVRSARAASVGSTAVSEWRVAGRVDDGPVDWDRVVGTVRAAMEGRLAVAARVDERTRTYRSRLVEHLPTDVRVAFDEAGDDTVIEVTAPDAVGVLYRITRALAELDLDIRRAHVQTVGHQVVDAFYVRRVGDPGALDGTLRDEVVRAVHHAVGA